MKSFSCLTTLFPILLFLVSPPTAHAQGQTSIYRRAALTEFVFFQNSPNSAKSDTSRGVLAFAPSGGPTARATLAWRSPGCDPPQPCGLVCPC